jgi:predicted methyltransferase
MPEPQEEAQFRRHLAELRQAASGLGSDFAHEFSDLDDKIERFGRATGKEAKYLAIGESDRMTLKFVKPKT